MTRPQAEWGGRGLARVVTYINIQHTVFDFQVLVIIKHVNHIIT